MIFVVLKLDPASSSVNSDQYLKTKLYFTHLIHHRIYIQKYRFTKSFFVDYSSKSRFIHRNQIYRRQTIISIITPKPFTIEAGSSFNTTKIMLNHLRSTSQYRFLATQKNISLRSHYSTLIRDISTVFDKVTKSSFLLVTMATPAF